MNVTALNPTANINSFSVSIKQAAIELESICKTYLSKNNNGEYVIPINRQRPVMLIGPAGIGKTDIPRQTAEKLGLGFVSYSITHHTRQSALGLPKIVTKNYHGEETLTTEYTASEIISSVNDVIENEGKENGILFIDEVNCASETLAAPLLQLFQNKTLGQSRIPNGWILVMAGNPPEYNKSVKEFDAVTRDRLRIINVVPDCKAWLEYAEKANINEYIVSFISMNNISLHAFDENSNEIVTPRGWEELSLNLNCYLEKGFAITPSFIAEFIGIPTIAADFYNYYRFISEAISEKEISMIVEGVDHDKLIKKLTKSAYNTRYMLVCCLKKKLHSISAEKNNEKANTMMDNIVDFIDKAYGKNVEMELLMSGFLSDPEIVKMAIKTKNEKFGKYLKSVTNAEKDIKKKMAGA